MYGRVKLSFEGETRALSHLPTSLRISCQFPDRLRQVAAVADLNDAAAAVLGNEARDLAVRVSDEDRRSARPRTQ